MSRCIAAYFCVKAVFSRPVTDFTVKTIEKNTGLLYNRLYMRIPNQKSGKGCICARF